MLICIFLPLLYYGSISMLASLTWVWDGWYTPEFRRAALLDLPDDTSCPALYIWQSPKS